MTEHIEASKEQIAKTVIMPGDPLRAKMIAEKYLTDYKLVNTVRNNYAYTGFYNGKKVTIMSSGMGMPSIGIYSYELFKYYDVDKIIRIGTCGAYTSELRLYDTVLATKVYSDSNYAYLQNGSENHEIMAFDNINHDIRQSAMKLGITLIEAPIHSTDVFYRDNFDFRTILNKYGCVGVEMESFALFHNAKLFNKEAACLLTVSNSLVDLSETTSEERQNNFLNMIEIALNTL